MDSAGDELADRLRALLAGEDVEERRMFGTRAFLAGGRMLAAARPGGVLLIRVAADAEHELLRRPGASRAVMGTRTMSARWIDVSRDAVARDDDLLTWLDAARDGAPEGAG